jgi:hypothetical protein
MAGKVPALRRHPYSRKLATLLATVVYLEAKATDDAEWQWPWPPESQGTWPRLGAVRRSDDE